MKQVSEGIYQLKVSSGNCTGESKKIVVYKPKLSLPVTPADSAYFCEGKTVELKLPEAKDFVTDAHAHMKFIGYTAGAAPLIEAARLKSVKDKGWIDLDKVSADAFLKSLRALRYWQRN